MNIDLNYTDSFRGVMIIILLLAWYSISRRLPEHWVNMTRLGKRLFVAYYGLLFAVAYATVNALKLHRPITSANYVLMTFSLWLAIAGLVHFKGDNETGPVYKFQIGNNPTKWRIYKLR